MFYKWKFLLKFRKSFNKLICILIQCQMINNLDVVDLIFIIIITRSKREPDVSRPPQGSGIHPGCKNGKFWNNHLHSPVLYKQRRCKHEKFKFHNLQYCSQGFIQQFFGCQDCARHFDQTIRKVFRGVKICPAFMDGFKALLCLPT